MTSAGALSSGPVSFSQAGAYYWQAVYSGDANNNGATSACASELITIAKNSPTVTTALVTVSPQMALATITDSATLAGATTDAGGTVTYTLYSGTTAAWWPQPGGHRCRGGKRRQRG